MAEVFPPTLQDKFNQASFNFIFGDTTIRSQPDFGPVKIRRRFTTPIDSLMGTIDLEFDDYSTLKTFYDTTLNGGVSTFTYTHPITQTTAEFRFLSPPTLSSMGGLYFKVTFEWEVV